MLVSNGDIINFMFNGVELVGQLVSENKDSISVKMPLGLIVDQMNNLNFMEYLLGQTPDSVVTFHRSNIALSDSVQEAVAALYEHTVKSINEPQPAINTGKPAIKV